MRLGGSASFFGVFGGRTLLGVSFGDPTCSEGLLGEVRLASTFLGGEVAGKLGFEPGPGGCEGAPIGAPLLYDHGD